MKEKALYLLRQEKSKKVLQLQGARYTSLSDVGAAEVAVGKQCLSFGYKLSANLAKGIFLSPN